MDGLTLLREVSEAYRNLQSLSLEASLIQESGDENADQRNERRVRFSYVPPDPMRYEPFGKRGIPQVAGGKNLHTVRFVPPQFGGTQFHSVPADRQPLPHRFHSKWPVSGEAFLFEGIDDQAASAEILRQERGCYVVAVGYAQPPLPEGMRTRRSPVLFRVDERNRMVMRLEGEIGHRHPMEEEVSWSRHTAKVSKIPVNEPIPEETFQFTAPPDATRLPTGQHGGSGWGGGFGSSFRHDPDNKRRYESRHSHDWQGDALVENAGFKLRGMTLTFERRLSFSDDGAELRVDERITGPKGAAETNCKLLVG